MAADGSRDVYGGYGIYGDGEPDLRDYRTPPFIEEELLDPANQLWQPGNLFLRLHPEYLYPCLGERIVRAADANATSEARKRAARELERLRRSIRTYFKRTGRPPGRPPKLTVIERESMPGEHAALYRFIRDRCAIDTDAPVPRAILNRLFQDPIFQKELFAQFPFKRASTRKVWNRFLRETSPLALTKRVLRYLGLRYNVSHHTIHSAIWADHHPSRTTEDSSRPFAG
jgi:hypothetical protein